MVDIATITLFTNKKGPLSKHIELVDGKIKSDVSGCLMTHGNAERIEVASAKELAALIGDLDSDQALGLGDLRAGLHDYVEIVTKDRNQWRAAARHNRADWRQYHIGRRAARMGAV